MKAIIAIAICFALVGAQNWNTTFSTSAAQNGASCCIPTQIGFSLNPAGTTITINYNFPSSGLNPTCGASNITGPQIDTLTGFINGTDGFEDTITDFSFYYLPAPFNNYSVYEYFPTICSVTVYFNNGSTAAATYTGSNYTYSCSQLAINYAATFNASTVSSQAGIGSNYSNCTFGITPSGSSASKIALGAFAVVVSFLALF